MISVKINGIEYTNIAYADPSVKYDFYYEVKTMDGKMHRSIKGKRTNYNISFFNNDLELYESLKTILLSADTVELSVPNNKGDYQTDLYFVTVSHDTLKGKMWNGQYYNTRLLVTFEKVGYDNE